MGAIIVAPKWVGAAFHGNASTIWCASHSDVGCRVTANQREVVSTMTHDQKRNRRPKVSVGATHRSIAAMASAWLRRNVRQVCDGGPRCRVMILASKDRNSGG